MPGRRDGSVRTGPARRIGPYRAGLCAIAGRHASDGERQAGVRGELHDRLGGAPSQAAPDAAP
ncbi:hypothetical protein [Streptomyces shenzhenensis]|uniref:hypothetical protein n=1 Tax=Streptomyces shenzhenensis TaxID=943815 RepID=UPI001F32BBB7|nr:hypothetical protein [Streptomyces shenzhenensis]